MLNRYLSRLFQFHLDRRRQIVHDQRIQAIPTNMRIIVKNAFVETHYFIELVERYHESLRRAYSIIAVEISEIESQLTLQMTFKTLNDSARSNDLVSTLLMFDVYSRMIEANAFSPTITQRATVMRKIMNKTRKLHSFRQINDDLFIISI